MHKSNGINLVYKSIFPLLQSIYDKIFERKIIMTINQNSWSSSENGLTVFINIFVSLPVHSKLYIPKTILQEWIFQYDQQSWLSVGEDEPEFDSEQFLKNASSIISTATATVDSTISHKLQDLLRHLGVKTSLRRYQLQGIEWMYDHYNEVYGNSSENDRRITERNNSVSFVLPDGRFILKSNDDHVILAYDLWREELEALRHFTPHSTSCSSNGIILADEMGLGKSLQILCLILLAKQNYGIRVKELNISPVNATGSTAKREDIKGCPCER
jgi:SNF2 family DNA or RNA helicase